LDGNGSLDRLPSDQARQNRAGVVGRFICHGTFALRIDGDWFRVTVSDGSIDITRARTEQPTVSFETDAATLRSVAFGREPVTEAERDGRPTVTGDRVAAERFARMFTVPDGGVSR
jgi:hypothetical protein